MRITLISRPLIHVSHMPRSGVSLLADALRTAGTAGTAGTTVVEDVWVTASSDMDTAFTAGALELRERWAQLPPDVVHTIGIVATMTAIKAGGRAPVVATFDEMPANAALELELARLVAGVIPMSRAERERLRRHGVPTLSAGTFPMPIPIPNPDACAQPRGDVITLSSDGSLDALVASMGRWAPARLVIAARLSATRLAGLLTVADGQGSRGRIDYRPGLRGDQRAAMWAQAAVVVCGVDGSRHGGHVLEAAAHGVPSIAVAQGAHLDLVVHGTTGILVAPTANAVGLGQAVTSVIDDPFRVRAMGTSALVRVRAQHEPGFAGQRLMSMYQQVMQAPSQLTLATRPAIDRSCVGCVDSCAGCPLHPGMDLAGRNALAEDNLPLARQLARWYTGRGQSTEDLVQVASVGLVIAAERFDPSRGKEFHSFAIPTILGELRRHFRDHSWAVRVPRTLQESTLQVARATEDLRQTLGREATVADLAVELNLVPEQVRLAQLADGEAHSTRSLDHPVGEGQTQAELVGELDPQLDHVEFAHDVRAVLARLPAREQTILIMRFYGERTQSEIAEALGISQVHVSRVLSRTLAAVRDHLLEDIPLPTAWNQPDAPIPRPRHRP